VDYAAPTGHPYLDPLAGPGSVVYAGEDTGGPDCSDMAGSQPPHRGYGNFIRHSATVDGHFVEIWGAHLYAFAVGSGDPTTPGQVLGSIGSTGCSTGAHLHFSVRVDGLYVDPLTLIP
jgi:murein DD-endopeptidase MepM/ murein hydrolase activator NlpD